jgi:hypothetical protein
MLEEEATPVMRRDTTIGTTVMRMAFIHKVPIGSITLTSFKSTGEGALEPESRKRFRARAPQEYVLSET